MLPSIIKDFYEITHVKRSQTHFDAEELSKNGYSSTLSVTKLLVLFI
jgi:hypothetical protein